MECATQSFPSHKFCGIPICDVLLGTTCQRQYDSGEVPQV